MRPYVSANALAPSRGGHAPGSNMMGGYGGGWMGGGMWLSLVLVIVVAGLVAYIVARKKK